MTASDSMPLDRGVRTRVLLIAAMIAVTTTVTGGSLLIIRNRILQHARQELRDQLTQSVVTLKNLQQQRSNALLHENALLADLSSLKALMTTHDRGTIQDGAIEFWKVSGSDLFALADASGKVLTIDTQGKSASPAVLEALQESLQDELQDTTGGSEKRHYLVADRQLFDFSSRPLFFGEESHGTLLGYVISGYRIDRSVLMSQASGTEVTFLAGSEILASTLPPQLERELLKTQQASAPPGDADSKEMVLAGEQYLGTEADLSQEAGRPLRLVMLKSFHAANRAVHETNRLVLLLGIAAILLGSVLMLVLARSVTRPLEVLAQGVRAFGSGDDSRTLPRDGTREVRELSVAFDRMRREILTTNRTLLEAEKLATIGRMASSVSHDLRHYLAAVYANAEFLSAPSLPERERLELFADIHGAVHGATELLDSLLIFSKTGKVCHRERNSVLSMVERCVALLRAHPEAEGVTMRIQPADPGTTYALVDAKQMQRAIYNLLLNACQSAGSADSPGEVNVSINRFEETLRVTITDTGPGVAEHIRTSLFEPFVSDGKQSGTGLGLTLANSVAKDHGGSVTLLSTRPGETVFELSFATGAVVAESAVRTSNNPRSGPSFPAAGGTSA